MTVMELVLPDTPSRSPFVSKARSITFDLGKNIESHHAHKPVEYKHEGEEFIYVMDGDLEFTLGGKIHVLKKGECIHFNSDIPHRLKSLSNEPTRCLVMLYTV